MQHFPDARSVVRALAPDEPIILNRPHAAARAARFFVEKFPGKSLYAVKANPSPDLLRVLWDAGVTHYDVASIGEVRVVKAALNGQPIDPAASYRVTLNNFIAAGGDGFAAFRQGTDPVVGPLDLDAIEQYLRAGDVIQVPPPGRVTVVGE